MIDIHTHILPGLDDGAADIYDSLEMAALAYESGTRVIAATPHCNVPGAYTNYFGREYRRVFERTKEIIQKEIPGITLLAGMEVFATEELPRLLTEGMIFPVNRTRYVLMEFDFMEDPDFADEIIRRVMEVRAVPLIAHAERYEFVQDDPDTAARWKQAGCAIQINKGSFMGRFGTAAKKTAYELIRRDLAAAVASDAHSPVRRTTCMADAYDHLRYEYSREYLDLLFKRNPGNICNGAKPLYLGGAGTRRYRR